MFTGFIALLHQYAADYLSSPRMLQYIIWNPSPEIFTIPGIDWPVRWYGLMWALAFIGSHFFMNRVYKAELRTDKQLDTLTLYIILGTVIGARLGHCLFYGPWFDEYDHYGRLISEGYLSHPLNILKVYEGGLASHGGGNRNHCRNVNVLPENRREPALAFRPDGYCGAVRRNVHPHRQFDQ